MKRIQTHTILKFLRARYLRPRFNWIQLQTIALSTFIFGSLFGLYYLANHYVLPYLFAATTPWSQTDWSGGAASGTVTGTVTTYESVADVEVGTVGSWVWPQLLAGQPVCRPGLSDNHWQYQIAKVNKLTIRSEYPSPMREVCRVILTTFDLPDWGTELSHWLETKQIQLLQCIGSRYQHSLELVTLRSTCTMETVGKLSFEWQQYIYIFWWFWHIWF